MALNFTITTQRARKFHSTLDLSESGRGMVKVIVVVAIAKTLFPSTIILGAWHGWSAHGAL